MILNLANAKNGDIQYQLINFPDGHKHINLDESLPIIENIGSLSIRTRIKSYDDLFILKQAVSVLRGYKASLILNLDIVYLLASRYDRQMHTNDSFDLSIICDDINALNFRSIRVLEPHSPTTLALLKRSVALSGVDQLATTHLKGCVAAPDLGAVKRVEEFVKSTHNDDIKVIFTHKKRKLSTGEILGIRVFNPEEIEEDVLIYDDLCDGGRTFIELAKVLRQHGAKNITLAVTHAIFSKGWDVLLTPTEDGGYVDQIVTTNSFYNWVSSNPKVKVRTVI